MAMASLFFILVPLLLFHGHHQQAAVATSFSIAAPFKDIIVKGNASKAQDHLELSVIGSLALNHSTGRAYYAKEIQFRDSLNSSLIASFSTWFLFQIVASGNPGDGMAFIIVPDSSDPPPGSDGQYLGLVNFTSNSSISNHLFAVEFDTYPNARDPLYNHVGLDINSISSLVTAAIPGDNPTGELTLYAWIDYDSPVELVEIRVSNTFQRPLEALISYRLDLASVLQEKMYVGFSASTGASTELHRLLLWNFSTSGIIDPASSPAPSPAPSPAASPVSTRKPKPKGSKHRKRSIILAASASVVLAAVAILSWFACLKKPSLRRFEHGSSPLVHFSYSELTRATRGFSENQLLGRGAFGRVYKGVFPGTTVAVKLLTEASVDSEHQFLAELSTLGEFQHPNLVSLRGWCQGKGRLMLVYDYMPNGSLDKHLFLEEAEVLSWNQRCEIIKGVAEAVIYLHEGRGERIVHRDIKAANVLLDKNFCAKLGDFGLARLLDQREGLQTMTKAGTIGYIAPELAYTGRATEKSDVYGFGILSLEVVSGRRTIDILLQLDKGMVLLDWVWHLHESGRLLEAVDARLDKAFDEDVVRRVLYMAIACCHLNANCRPTMRECFEILTGGRPAPIPPQSRPANLFFSDSSNPIAYVGQQFTSCTGSMPSSDSSI